MILAVTEHFHDYEPQKYFLDTDKLNATNHVESLILKEIKKASKNLDVLVDASNWEDNPVFNGSEPGVNENSKVKNPKSIDKALTLTIDFDC